jgi:Leucine rich repeat
MKAIMVLTTLIITVSAIDIECEFRMAQSLLMLDLYACRVINLTLTDSKSLEIVTGDHLSRKSNADVKEIYFTNHPCDLDFIPQNIHKHFPNIILIEFDNCKIRSLTGDELKDYVNLEKFSIDSNGIRMIPGSLFQNNPKMKYISFIDNKITKVGSNLLTRLEHLTYVDFKYNNCISKSADNRTSVLELVEELKEKCAYPEDPSAKKEKASGLKLNNEGLGKDLQEKSGAPAGFRFSKYLFCTILCAIFVQIK